jgi:hypothetical protein
MEQLGPGLLSALVSPPNQRLKLTPPDLGRIPFVRQHIAVLHPSTPFARRPGRRSLTAVR